MTGFDCVCVYNLFVGVLFLPSRFLARLYLIMATHAGQGLNLTSDGDDATTINITHTCDIGKQQFLFILITNS